MPVTSRDFCVFVNLNPTLQENQAVHDELRRAAEERESLKLKVQEYAQSILRYEEAIAVKASRLRVH